MAKHVATVTSNTTVYLATVVKPHNADMYLATASVYGSFGGGTVNLQMSPDGGTTKINLRDINGVVAITDNNAVDIALGCGAKNSDNILLYAVLSGATAPSLTVTVHDNG
jgi:hypothetical protein